MRISHISIIPEYSPGIFKKIEEKAKISKKEEMGIDFYLINPSVSYTDDNLYVIQVSYGKIPSTFLRKSVFRAFKILNLKKYIPLDQYDAIVLRYPLVDGFGTIKFSKQYGHKMFTEHHSDEVSELLAVGRPIDIIRAYLEKKLAAKFLSNIKGIIGVTDEIRKLQLIKAHKKLCSTVIANGINPKNYSYAGFTPFDGKNLKLIFSASQFYPWHGLEKLLKLLKNYQGKAQIHLKLIGRLSKEQKKIIYNIKNPNVNIELVGFINGKYLDLHMKNVNLAISSLALSAKNMKEACTLKSREYIVRGIPFVYAYKDPDLTGEETFAKRFQEDNITIEAIMEFARFITKNKVLVEEELKKYVDIVSLKNKLIMMKNFVKKCLENNVY